MATQTKTLSGAEHDWYATRSGIAGNAPLNDHKRAYYSSKGFDLSTKPLAQVEEEWLLSVAARDCGGVYDQWVGACQAQSVPVGKSIDECKFNFFTGVTAGTNP